METTIKGAAPDLLAPWLRYKASLHRRTPCTSNRASSLGGDCERELVYWRTHWEDAAEPSLALQIIFQEGDKHEREVLLELVRAGVHVIEQQCGLEWRALMITGHVDATVVHEGESIPIDVKSMSSHIWDGVFRGGSQVYAWPEVEEAFTRKPWLRKYLGQVTLYALLRGSERAMLLCLNKGKGALAQVNVELDYEYAESLLRRAERINAHVEAGTLPDRIPFDEEVCPHCPFYAACLPDHAGRDPLAFLEDAVVEGLLEERAEHEDGARVFNRADDRLKAWAKARPEERLTVGRWFLEKKKIARGVRVEVKALEDRAPAVAG